MVNPIPKKPTVWQNQSPEWSKILTKRKWNWKWWRREESHCSYRREQLDNRDINLSSPLATFISLQGISCHAEPETTMTLHSSFYIDFRTRVPTWAKTLQIQVEMHLYHAKENSDHEKGQTGSRQATRKRTVWTHPSTPTHPPHTHMHKSADLFAEMCHLYSEKGIGPVFLCRW